MALQLPPHFARLLHQVTTVAVLATTDADGSPHVTFDHSLHIGDDGRLVYLEFEELSRTNRNLVRSIWFSRSVTVHGRGLDGRAFQVRGRPWKAVISGPLFEHYYVLSRATRADADLSTVWLITPEELSEELSEETPAVRAARHAEGRIPLIHLDRIARHEP